MKNEVLNFVLDNAKNNSIDKVPKERVEQLVNETESALGKELTGYISVDKPYEQYYTPEMLADNYPRNTIGLEVLSRADAIRDRVAFKCDGDFTYGELCDETLKYAYILKNKYNIKKGDYIVMDVLSTPDAICAMVAANVVGARVRPIDPIYGVEQISAIIDEYNPKMIISNPLQFASMSKAIGDKNIPVSYILLKDNMPFVSAVKKGIINLIEKTCTSKLIKGKKWNSFHQEVNSINLEDAKLEELAEKYIPNEIAMVFPTSGTTGEAKGVEVTNENFLSNVYKEYISDFEIDDGDALFNPMPTCSSFFWYCIVLATFLGVTTSLSPLFNAKNSPQQIAEDESSWILLGPIIINQICNYIENGSKEKYDNIVEYVKYKLFDSKRTENIQSLMNKKKLVSGGDLLQLDLEKRAVEMGLPINNNLGTSENTGPCTNPNGGMRNGRGYYLGCVGVPLPGNDVVIFKYDEENNRPAFDDENYNKGLQYYEIGEICYSCNNPNVFQDYYNNEKATNDTKLYHDDGSYWYHSGDLGYMDPAGHLFCCGRKFGLIVRDGHKVWAPKIENVIKSSKGIADCAVIGVEDVIDKEVPAAFIVFDEDVNEEMKNTIKNRITSEILRSLDSKHVPTTWIEIESIPRNLMQKAKIGELKEMYNVYLEKMQQVEQPKTKKHIFAKKERI